MLRMRIRHAEHDGYYGLAHANWGDYRYGMSDSIKSRIQVFQPDQEFNIVERRLPHWSQAGTIAFITWRTDDSIPETILKNWSKEHAAWLRSHGIDSTLPGWPERMREIDPNLPGEYRQAMSDRWNEHLDACLGACVLRRPELAKIVAGSLQHFDGDRYNLTDYVVMPNHVHVMAAFPDEARMLAQCESWKRFTATKINEILRRKGRFWQTDAFDHLVRSLEQFEYLRRYIANNPVRAKLRPSEYIHWSRSM